MQTYIVRVYRARPEDEGAVSGLIEDIESGRQEFFKSLLELQSKLAHSIGKGQLGFTDLVPQEQDAHDNVAVIG